ncbi:hypothetical protein BXZ70DRAFT_899709, partial [Cristinia sonorae]
FFARHPVFNYDPSFPIIDEFHRMSETLNWKDKTRQKKMRQLRGVMVVQFNEYYGTEVGDVEAWRAMCGVLGVWPVPETLKKCRTLVKRQFVNLVDYVEAKKSGTRVQRFRSLKELSEYTYGGGKGRTNRVFPKDDAKAGGVLKYLLRKVSVFRPPDSVVRG